MAPINGIKAGLSKADDLIEVIMQRAMKSGKATVESLSKDSIAYRTPSGRASAWQAHNGVQQAQLQLYNETMDTFTRSVGKTGGGVDYVSLNGEDIIGKSTNPVTRSLWDDFLDKIFG